MQTNLFNQRVTLLTSNNKCMQLLLLIKEKLTSLFVSPIFSLIVNKVSKRAKLFWQCTSIFQKTQ